MFSFSYCGETTLFGLRPPYCWGFEDTHTHTHTIVSRTSLDEESARRRDLSQSTYNTHKTPLPLAGFEPVIPASDRPQTHALDRAATGIGYTVDVRWQKPCVTSHMRRNVFGTRRINVSNLLMTENKRWMTLGKFWICLLFTREKHDLWNTNLKPDLEAQLCIEILELTVHN